MANIQDGTPRVLDVLTVDATSAIDGNVLVTLRVYAHGTNEPDGQILFRVGLENAEELSGKLRTAIIQAKVQLGT